ncbi:MAG: hypothetical protein RL095_3515 [Verrucomicrobiota bacterium]|jgi:hypothetical protein
MPAAFAWLLLSATSLTAGEFGPEWSPAFPLQSEDGFSIGTSFTSLRLSDPKGRKVLAGPRPGRRVIETFHLQSSVFGNKPHELKSSTDMKPTWSLWSPVGAGLPKEVFKSPQDLRFTLDVSRDFDAGEDESPWRDGQVGMILGDHDSEGGWGRCGIFLGLPLAKFSGEETAGMDATEWQLALDFSARKRIEAFYLEGGFRIEQEPGYEDSLSLHAGGGFVAGPVDLGFFISEERHFSHACFPLFQRWFQDDDGHRRSVGPRLRLHLGDSLDLELSHEWPVSRQSDEPEAVPEDRSCLSLLWRF